MEPTQGPTALGPRTRESHNLRKQTYWALSVVFIPLRSPEEVGQVAMSVPKVNKVVNPGIVARNFVIFTMARTRPLRAKIVARTYDFFLGMWPICSVAQSFIHEQENAESKLIQHQNKLSKEKRQSIIDQKRLSQLAITKSKAHEARDVQIRQPARSAYRRFVRI